MKLEQGVPRVGVISRVTIQAGRRNEALALFEEYVRQQVAEPGGTAEIMTVNADLENRDVLWLYASFADVDEYEAHFHTQARRSLHLHSMGLWAKPAELFRVEPTSLRWPHFVSTTGRATAEPINSVTEEVT